MSVDFLDTALNGFSFQERAELSAILLAQAILAYILFQQSSLFSTSLWPLLTIILIFWTAFVGFRVIDILTSRRRKLRQNRRP